MSFLYPRTCSITRVQNIHTVQDGFHASEVSVATNVPCNVQLKRDMGFQVPHAFPSSSNTDSPQPLWVCYVRLKIGTVQKMDKLVDDQGMEYQIEAVYWSPLGTQIEMREYKP